MQNLFTRLIAFVVISLFIFQPAEGQERVDYDRDFETWTSATLNYKINKKLKLSLNQQLRLKDNSSTIDSYFTQFEADYKLGKGFSIASALRFIKENDTKGKIQGYENHFRWQSDISYKHDLGRFKMTYRVRYQSKNELNIGAYSPNNIYRLKLGSTYKIPKWKLDPEASVEVFNSLTNKEGFHKLRFTFGTEYETKNVGDFQLFFRREIELIGTNPFLSNIVGFKYAYTIKRRK